MKTGRLIITMVRFETVFWSSILNCINVVSKKLQQEDADIGLIIDLYKSLIIFISSFRENNLSRGGECANC